MTEQEKRRRRREMERRMRSRETSRRAEAQSGLLAFRTYVSAVLVGACLLLSLFDSASAQAVCGRIKETIAAQISVEQVRGWQERAEAFWKQRRISLPVFREKREAETEQKVYQPDTEETERAETFEEAP